MTTERENITSLNDRIAASRPDRPYPRSVRHHGAWVDGRVLPIKAQVIDEILDPLEQVHHDDRRWLGVAAVVLACALAAFLLLFVIAPKRAPHPCPLGTSAAQCRVVHTPQDLRAP